MKLAMLSSSSAAAGCPHLTAPPNDSKFSFGLLYYGLRSSHSFPRTGPLRVASSISSYG